jgi:hypothetical protein
MGDNELHPIDEAQAERGRAMVHAAVAQTRAPLALRERIEAERERRQVGGIARRRWTLGGSFAAVAAAAAVAIVVAGGGGGGGPTVAEAAALAGRAPTAAAPAVDPTHPGLLKRSVGGVSYPSWKGVFPWHASGAREDKLDGRRAVTVFYENPDRTTIGYTIVAGKPLAEPSGPGLRQGSEHYVVLRRGARTIVTWRRGGHTCVLSGPAGVPRQKLLALASWSGTEIT